MLVKAERPMPQILPFPLGALAAFGDVLAGGCARAIARFMTALHETRRQEAARTLARHSHLVDGARPESADRTEAAS
jgi:hypothetical protein